MSNPPLDKSLVRGTNANTSFSKSPLKSVKNSNIACLEEFLMATRDERKSTTLDLPRESQTIDNDEPLTAELFPPGIPLVSQKYSMETDMMFGWKPKPQMGGPIPLVFNSKFVDEVLKALPTKSSTSEFPFLLYLGARPKNSFEMHRDFLAKSSYSFLHTHLLHDKIFYSSVWNNNEIKPTVRPFKGMNPETTNFDIIFDSEFESGNLDAVVQTKADEYDLYLRNDSNTKGHTNWFYFKVKNGSNRGKIKFNIMNLSKKNSLFKIGMKPYIFSQKEYELMKTEWKQAGEDIKFENDFIIDYSQNTRDNRFECGYSKLTFKYTFEYDLDTVSFALCIPYEYTRMLKHLEYLQSRVGTNMSREDNFLKISNLCYSFSGVKIPLLTITDPDESIIPFKKRQVIICTGRVHPGESNGSWMMEGFLNELCNDNPVSRELRQRYLFKIIPMLNPDGVLIGNHRTGLCGNDLNRRYVNPKESLHPPIFHLKKICKEIIAEYESIFLYIDFHGHALRKNVFMYGAEFPIFDPKYFQVKVFPRIISKNTDMFRFYSCKFRIVEAKLGTSRAVLFKEFGVVNSYTLEASLFCYFNNSRDTIPMTTRAFLDMGEIVCRSLFDYMNLLEMEENKLEKSPRKKTSRTRLGYSFDQNTMRRYLERSNSQSGSRSQGELNIEKAELSKLQKLIEELKVEEMESEEKGNEEDVENIEGRSDSEDSEDDYDREEQLMFHKDMIKKFEDFNSVLKNQVPKSTGTTKRLKLLNSFQKAPASAGIGMIFGNKITRTYQQESHRAVSGIERLLSSRHKSIPLSSHRGSDGSITKRSNGTFDLDCPSDSNRYFLGRTPEPRISQENRHNRPYSLNISKLTKSNISQPESMKNSFEDNSVPTTPHNDKNLLLTKAEKQRIRHAKNASVSIINERSSSKDLLRRTNINISKEIKPKLDLNPNNMMIPVFQPKKINRKKLYRPRDVDFQKTSIAIFPQKPKSLLLDNSSNANSSMQDEPSHVLFTNRLIQHAKEAIQQNKRQKSKNPNIINEIFRNVKKEKLPQSPDKKEEKKLTQQQLQIQIQQQEKLKIKQNFSKNVNLNKLLQKRLTLDKLLDFPGQYKK